MIKLSLIVAAGIGCATCFTPSASIAQPSQLLALNTVLSASATARLALHKTDEPSVDFCGEKIPVNHPAITERWTRTLVHQAAMAADLAVLKRRASVVFPLIEPILKQYHIPSDFKYLPLLESAVTNRAVSRKGAAGFWQLMPQTAQSLGLTVSHRHDDRFNLVKATHAACRYINELYEQLGSWMLVATAYNAGPNYIQQLVRRYPDLHPMALPYRAAETKAYLFQTVVIKELITRPQIYRDQISGLSFARLTGEVMPMESAERASILASFDLDEEALASHGVKYTVEPVFVIDTTTTVALMNEETNPTGITEQVESKPVERATAPVAAVVVPVDRLVTRSLSTGPLTEGQLCVFQVVQPIQLNGRAFAVGDMIQAHIDVIDAGSGRVFLRTDRLTTAVSQETFSLTLVATGQPRQPGVALPARLENWQLTWEAL